MEKATQHKENTNQSKHQSQVEGEEKDQQVEETLSLDVTRRPEEELVICDICGDISFKEEEQVDSNTQCIILFSEHHICDECLIQYNGY